MEFDEFMGDFDGFSTRYIEKIQKFMEKINKASKDGSLKGEWQVERIDQPSVKGYVIQGHFSSNQAKIPFDPLNPLEPWDPMKRRPVPSRPFDLSEVKSQEQREPLTDIFEEKDAIKIFIEVPGENKEDIHLNLTENQLEVKAKNFYKILDLPTRNKDVEEASSTYKNGVLQVTIPKKETTLGEEKRKIEIE